MCIAHRHPLSFTSSLYLVKAYLTQLVYIHLHTTFHSPTNNGQTGVKNLGS